MPLVADTHCAVIVGGAMVIPQLEVVTVSGRGDVESVTLTVNENGPAVVGVPEIVPVLASSVRPGGSDPLAIANL